MRRATSPYPGDIDADKIGEHLAGRRRLPKKDGGISTRTSNLCLKAVRQFCKWMCHPKRRYLRFNPPAGAEVGNAEADLRHARRDLKPDELVKLLDAAGARAKPFRGLTGPELKQNRVNRRRRTMNVNAVLADG